MNGARKFAADAILSLSNKTSHGLKIQRFFSEEKANISLKKCLLVSKVTRYEYEQRRHHNASENQIEELIRRRGSDYEALVHYHKMQKEFERSVEKTLRELGAEVKVVNRLTYSPALIEWCDVVMPCGGDGTFLLAASKVRDSTKPVVGLNSDPSRSEGRLCLPKWCSRDIKGALEAIKNGKFTWLHRSRIRTILASDERLRSVVQGTPVDLHKPILPRYNVCDNGSDESKITNSYGIQLQAQDRLKTEPFDRNNQPGIFKRTLPYLALNEVFIGENVSARVSHLQLKIDKNSRPTRVKCSGLCVSTGTGSTSWHLSINCLRSQSVHELMQLLSETFEVSPVCENNINVLTKMYNDNLVFSPDDTRLAYTIRELISGDVWPSRKALNDRGFTNTVHVKSRCVDAGLVIDGGMSFPFNDGTEATLEVHPEDSLRTITFNNE